jgi:2-isopropylmalate synthase
MDGPAVNQVIDDLKRLEHEGYHFEAADASLELLMRRATGGWEQDWFKVESMRVITDELPNGDFTTEATVKVWVGAGDRHVHTAEGNGPVNAIDTALRAAFATARTRSSTACT